MIRRLIAACAVTMLLSVTATAVVLDYLSDETLPEAAIERTFPSKALGETRGMIVQLPESYQREPARRYPVIYVLDGSSQDIHTARSAALMARIGLMPELIVVGLPNVSGEGRSRDYTPPFMVQDVERPDGPKGQADRFLSFIKDEVIPTIDADYRTAPTRLLAGHSRGGLLVAYSLIAEPSLFHARFAHSPALWREGNLIVTRLASSLRERPDLETFLYLSIGSEENAEMMAGFEQARMALAAAGHKGVRWQADVVAGANHQSNGEMATPLGFRALFASRIIRDTPDR